MGGVPGTSSQASPPFASLTSFGARSANFFGRYLDHMSGGSMTWPSAEISRYPRPMQSSPAFPRPEQSAPSRALGSGGPRARTLAQSSLTLVSAYFVRIPVAGAPDARRPGTGGSAGLGRKAR